MRITSYESGFLRDASSTDANVEAKKRGTETCLKMLEAIE